MIPNWAEIYNLGPGPEDTGGRQIQIVDQPRIGMITILEGTVIASGEHRVFDGDPRGVHGNQGVAILRDRTGYEVDRSPLLLDNRTDMSSRGPGSPKGGVQAASPTGPTSGRRGDLRRPSSPDVLLSRTQATRDAIAPGWPKSITISKD